MTGAYSRNKGVLCWIGLHRWKPVLRWMDVPYIITGRQTVSNWLPNRQHIVVRELTRTGRKCRYCGRRK